MNINEFLTSKGYTAEIESILSGSTANQIKAAFIGKDWSISPNRYIADKAAWQARTFRLSEILPMDTELSYSDDEGEGTIIRTKNHVTICGQTETIDFSGSVADFIETLIAQNANIGE